jgi:hypothetical protein
MPPAGHPPRTRRVRWFLREILDRPKNEKAFVLIPVGYPAEGCRVSDIRKAPGEVTIVE